MARYDSELAVVGSLMIDSACAVEIDRTGLTADGILLAAASGAEPSDLNGAEALLFCYGGSPPHLSRFRVSRL